LAEATGVFLYVFPGILPVPFYSNILQIGFAFAIDIAFAAGDGAGI